MSHIQEMFDAPGPIGRRKIQLASAISLVITMLFVIAIVWIFWKGGGFSPEKWSIFLETNVLRFFGKAALATLNAAFVGGVIALAAGVILALARLSDIRGLRYVSSVLVEVTRSLPTLLVLYFTILVLPTYGIRVAVYWQLIIALVVTNSAMICEVLRASMLAIPKGQLEAALSLGYTHRQALIEIILPQGFRAAMPSLVAQIIFLLKTTTLGYVISYEELLFTSRLVGEYSGHLLQSFIVVTAIYLVLNMILSNIAFWLERRMDRKRPENIESPSRSKTDRGHQNSMNTVLTKTVQ